MPKPGCHNQDLFMQFRKVATYVQFLSYINYSYFDKKRALLRGLDFLHLEQYDVAPMKKMHLLQPAWGAGSINRSNFIGNSTGMRYQFFIFSSLTKRRRKQHLSGCFLSSAAQ